MVVEIIYFFFARKHAITSEGDDFLTRSHHEKSHVETNLVVAGTRGTVSYSVCSHFVGVTCYCYCLENPFARNRYGITIIAKHIAENHILQTFFVILLRYIESYIFCCAELICVFFIGFQLLLTEAAGVGTSRINFVTQFVRKIHHRV